MKTTPRRLVIAAVITGASVPALPDRVAGASISFTDFSLATSNFQSVIELDGTVYIGGSPSLPESLMFNADNLSGGVIGIGPLDLAHAHGSDVFNGSIYRILSNGSVRQLGAQDSGFETSIHLPTGLAMFGDENQFYTVIVSQEGAGAVLWIRNPDGGIDSYLIGTNRRGLGGYVNNGIAYVFTADDTTIYQYELGPIDGGGLLTPSLDIVGQWAMHAPSSGPNDIFVRPLEGNTVELFVVTNAYVMRSQPFQVVPAPGAAALMALALLTTSTRRRPEGTRNTRPRRSHLPAPNASEGVVTLKSRHRPTKASDRDRAIMLMDFWALLHDRPVCWACRRES